MQDRYISRKTYIFCQMKWYIYTKTKRGSYNVVDNDRLWQFHVINIKWNDIERARVSVWKNWISYRNKRWGQIRMTGFYVLPLYLWRLINRADNTGHCLVSSNNTVTDYERVAIYGCQYMVCFAYSRSFLTAFSTVLHLRYSLDICPWPWLLW